MIKIAKTTTAVSKILKTGWQNDKELPKSVKVFSKGYLLIGVCMEIESSWV